MQVSKTLAKEVVKMMLQFRCPTCQYETMIVTDIQSHLSTCTKALGLNIPKQMVIKSEPLDDIFQDSEFQDFEFEDSGSSIKVEPQLQNFEIPMLQNSISIPKFDQRSPKGSTSISSLCSTQFQIYGRQPIKYLHCKAHL